MNQCSQAETVSPPQIIISVILPVFNGSQYLEEAIDSILSQSYTDFEFVIIDDGSTDNSASIINTYTDPRIRFYQQENQGLAATLNTGIALAKGTYIARQDQDDISLPDRLEKQISFLENNPDYGMVGTWASILTADKLKDTQTDRFHKHSTENIILQFELLSQNPFVHSSMMIRKTVFGKVGNYSTDMDRQPPEDYELWSRIAREFCVANIPEVLHVYREVHGSMSRTGDNPFLNHLLMINVENFFHVTESKYSENSLYDLAVLAHGEYDKYSGRTSFREITAMVREAAKNLCQKYGCDSSKLDDQVRGWLNNLRYHHFYAYYFGFLGHTIRKFIVRMVQKLNAYYSIWIRR